MRLLCLHLIVTLGGVIVDFELTAANANKRDAAADMLPDQAGRTIIGDKGYVSAPLAAHMQNYGVTPSWPCGAPTNATRYRPT